MIEVAEIQNLQEQRTKIFSILSFMSSLQNNQVKFQILDQTQQFSKPYNKDTLLWDVGTLVWMSTSKGLVLLNRNRS